MRFGVAMLWLLTGVGAGQAIGGENRVLDAKALAGYVERFNAADRELYANFVPNRDALEFLRTNVPRFECPDREIERTYYFRWWTYRKHLRKTPDGFVVTEFLPPVGWAAEHNTISCALGHHLYEGRWLREPGYLDQYTRFWFRKSTALHRYSHWFADGIWARACVTGDEAIPKELLDDLVANFRRWEKERRDPNGLFWQVDGADGMEVALGGTGYRATINSYMYGDALAIAAIAQRAGRSEVAVKFHEEAARLKQLVQTELWDAEAQFFKMRRRPGKPGEPAGPPADVRELYGFTPWYFHLPDPQFAVAWRQLMDPQGFYAPFGPTTAEQRHPRFTIAYRGHECQWNGPSWPYSTSVTLTALANLLQDDPSQKVVTRADYLATLQCYVRSHALRDTRLEVFGRAATPPAKAGAVTGTTVRPDEVPPPAPETLDSLARQPWIDENLNPYTGDWIARSLLVERKQKPEDRGKDYNHSTFCDLIITGLAGLRPRADEQVEVNPLAPENWDWFCLDGIRYRGHDLSIVWDRTGTRYGRGSGLSLLVDGAELAHRPDLGRLTARLP